MKTNIIIANNTDVKSLNLVYCLNGDHAVIEYELFSLPKPVVTRAKIFLVPTEIAEENNKLAWARHKISSEKTRFTMLLQWHTENNEEIVVIPDNADGILNCMCQTFAVLDKKKIFNGKDFVEEARELNHYCEIRELAGLARTVVDSLEWLDEDSGSFQDSMIEYQDAMTRWEDDNFRLFAVFISLFDKYGLPFTEENCKPRDFPELN